MRYYESLSSAEAATTTLSLLLLDRSYTAKYGNPESKPPALIVIKCVSSTNGYLISKGSPPINGLSVASDSKLSSGTASRSIPTAIEVQVPRTSVSAAPKKMSSQPISKLSQGAEEAANTSSAVRKTGTKFKRPIVELSSSPEMAEGPKSKKPASVALPPSKRATPLSGLMPVTATERTKALGADAKKPVATGGTKKSLGTAASSAPTSKAPDSIDDSDTILTLTLKHMDPKVIKHLIQKAGKGESEVAKAVKSIFIVAQDEVQQWQESDDQECYDDDGKQKVLVAKTEQPVKEAHNGKYEHRYAVCDRCKRTFDKGKNPVGACRWHPGTSTAFITYAATLTVCISY